MMALRHCSQSLPSILLRLPAPQRCFSRGRNVRRLGILRGVAAAAASATISRKSRVGRCVRQCSAAATNRAAGVTTLWKLLRQELPRIKAQAPDFSPEVAEILMQALDGITAEDLGVREQDASGIRSRSGVAYSEIYQGSDMTLAIFLLRAGARIPLHDHPGMTVFGRLLFGQMRSRSFDFESSGDQAVLHADKTLGPLPVTYSLGPAQGNIHELEAISDCAFFDLLAPSYDFARGRPCNYYKVHSSGDSDERFKLRRFEPWNFDMDFQPYRGPSFE
eukprot:TRINITY_DN33851_c0_g1_i1.p1 TRINITY_DN33851_c0_g1~~TRINITY_DN33851_c0_g1_i1.p1  ORF type:complete len:277 (-),score=35.89 TRINITY_DN33851_c0_g1_i1:28-858(-)